MNILKFYSHQLFSLKIAPIHRLIQPLLPSEFELTKGEVLVAAGQFLLVPGRKAALLLTTGHLLL